MYVFIVIFFVVGYPISWILTKILGEEESDLYSKIKMKKLFVLYEHEKLINESERRILTAAIEISDKRALDVMQPLDKVFMLNIDTTITREVLNLIHSSGFSRIPIYEGDRENILGILLT